MIYAYLAYRWIESTPPTHSLPAKWTMGQPGAFLNAKPCSVAHPSGHHPHGHNKLQKTGPVLLSPLTPYSV